MKTLKRMLAIFLVITMFAQIIPVSAATALIGDIVGGKAVIQNEFIKVTVDTKTGRFGIRTVEGQPVRKNDQDTSLTFNGDDPETSFTTFRINGTDYIFGNSYNIDASLAGFKDPIISELGETKIISSDDPQYASYVAEGCKAIMTPWEVEGVKITQVILLYPSTEGNEKDSGNVNVFYYINNTTENPVEVGSRILIDTQVGSNDGPEFQIGTISENLLTVERKLTADPVTDQGIDPNYANYYTLPDYWVMKDTLDPTNPLATNVVAYGYTDIEQYRDLSYMIVGHWNHLANYKYDLDEVKKNLDFTNDKNDYGTADSAVALYWEPETVEANSSSQLGTIYGLGEIIDPTSVLTINFPNPVTQAETNDDESAYLNDGVFDINVEVTNLALYDMEHDNLEITMTLESGLRFVSVDSYGNIIRKSDGTPICEYGTTKTVVYEKPVTAEQAENGEINPIQPGDSIATTFKVMATGKPWPTTRQYMVTATSPQLEQEFEKQYGSSADEDVKALYNASKANFIFLPAIGEGVQTQTVSVTPEECFTKDTKYLSMTMTNIEAYNPGSNIRSQKSEANFNLYLLNKVTGERFQVPVTDSVTTVVTDDGLTGEMRISYKSGTKVNEKGETIEAATNGTAELPVGEYCIEVDYISTDDDENTMLDVTSEQTFIVTTNEEARIREPGLLAVFKSTMDFSSGNMIAQLENLVNEVQKFIEDMQSTDSESSGVLDQITEGIYGSLEETAKEFLEELISPLSSLFDQLTDVFRFDADGEYLDEINEVLSEYPELSVLDFEQLKGYDLLESVMELFGTDDMSLLSADEEEMSNLYLLDEDAQSFAVNLKGVDIDAILAGPADKESGEITVESLGTWATEVGNAVPFITDTIELIKSVATSDIDFAAVADELVTYVKTYIDCNIEGVDIDVIADLINQGAKIFADGFAVTDIASLLEIDFVKDYIKETVAETFDVSKSSVNVDGIANLIRNAVNMVSNGVDVDTIIDSVVGLLPEDFIEFDNGDINIQTISDVLKKVVDLTIYSINNSGDLNTETLVNDVIDIFTCDFVQAFVKDLLEIEEDIDISGITDILKQTVNFVVDSIDSGSVDVDSIVDIIMDDYIQNSVMEILGLTSADINLKNLEDMFRQLVGVVADSSSFSIQTVIDLVTCDFVRDCVKNVLEVKDGTKFDTYFADCKSLLTDIIGMIEGSDDITGDVVGLVTSDFVRDCAADILGIEDTAAFNTAFADFGTLLTNIIGMIDGGSVSAGDVSGLVTSAFVKDCLKVALDIEGEEKTAQFDTRFNDFGSLMTQVTDIIENQNPSIEDIANLLTSDFVKDCLKELLGTETESDGYNEVDAFAELLNKVVGMVDDGVTADDAIEIVMSKFVQRYAQKALGLVKGSMTDEEKQELQDVIASLKEPVGLVVSIITTSIQSGSVDVDKITELVNTDFVQTYIRETLGITDEKKEEFKQVAEDFAALLKQIINTVTTLIDLDTDDIDSTIDTVIDSVVGIYTDDFVQKYVKEYLDLSDVDFGTEDVNSLGSLIKQVINLARGDISSESVTALVKNDFVQKYVKKCLNIGDFGLTKAEAESVGELLTEILKMALGETEVNAENLVSFMKNTVTSDIVQKYVREYFSIDEFMLSDDDVEAIGELLEQTLNMALGVTEVSTTTLPGIISDVVTNDFVQKNIRQFFGEETDLTDGEVTALGELLETILNVALGNTTVAPTSASVIDFISDIFDNDFVQKYVQEYFRFEDLGLTDKDAESLGELVEGILKLILGENVVNVDSMVDLLTNEFVVNSIGEYFNLSSEDIPAEELEDISDLLKQLINMVTGSAAVSVDNVVSLLTNDFVQKYVREYLNMDGNVYSMVKDAAGEVKSEYEKYEDEIKSVAELLKLILNTATSGKNITMDAAINFAKGIIENDFVQKYFREYLDLGADIYSMATETYNEYKDEVEALAGLAEQVVRTVRTCVTGTPSADDILSAVVSVLSNSYVQDFFTESFGDDIQTYVKKSGVDVAKVRTALKTAVELVISNADRAEVIETVKTALIKELVNSYETIKDSIDIDYDTMLELLDWGKDIYNAAMAQNKSVDSVVDAVMNKDAVKLLGDSLGITDVNVDFDLVTALLKWVSQVAVDTASSTITTKSFVQSFTDFIKEDAVSGFVKETFELDSDNAIKALAEMLNWSVENIPNNFNMSSVVGLVENAEVQTFVLDCVSDAVIASSIREFFDIDEDEISEEEIADISDLVKRIVNMATGSTEFDADNVVGLLTNDFVQKYVREYLSMGEDVYSMAKEAAEGIKSEYEKYEDEIKSLAELFELILNTAMSSESFTAETAISFAKGIIANDFVQKYFREYLDIGADIYGMAADVYNEYRDEVVSLAELLEQTVNTVKACVDGSVTRETVIDNVSDILSNSYVRDFFMDTFGDDVKAYFKDSGIDTDKVKTALKAAAELVINGEADTEVINNLKTGLMAELVDSTKKALGEIDFKNKDFDTLLKLLKWGKDIYNAATASNKSVDSVVSAVMNKDAVKLLGDSLGVTDVNVDFDLVTALLKWTAQTVVDAANGNMTVTGFVKSFADFVKDDAVVEFTKDAFELTDDTAVKTLAGVLDWSVDTVSGGFNLNAVKNLLTNADIQSFILDCVPVDFIKSCAEDVLGIAKDAISEDEIEDICELVKQVINMLLNTDSVTVDSVLEIFSNDFIQSYVREYLNMGKDIYEMAEAEYEKYESEIKSVTELLKLILDTAASDENITVDSAISFVKSVIENDFVQEYFREYLDIGADIYGMAKAEYDKYKDEVVSLAALAEQVINTVKTCVKGSVTKETVIDAVSAILSNSYVQDFYTESFGNDIQAYVNKTGIDTNNVKAALKAALQLVINGRPDAEVISNLKNGLMRELVNNSANLSKADYETILKLLKWGRSIYSAATAQNKSVDSIVNAVMNKSAMSMLAESLGVENNTNADFDLVTALIKWSAQTVVNAAGGKTTVKSFVKSFVSFIGDDAVTKFVKETFELENDNAVKAFTELLNWGVDTIPDNFSLDAVIDLATNSEIQSFVVDCFSEDFVLNSVKSAFGIDESTFTGKELEDIGDLLKQIVSMVMGSTDVSVDSVVSLFTNDFVQQYVRKYLYNEDIYNMYSTARDTYGKYQKEIASVAELLELVLDTATSGESFTAESAISFVRSVIENDFVQENFRDYLKVGEDIYGMATDAYNEYKDEAESLAALAEQSIRLVKTCAAGSVTKEDVLSVIVNVLSNSYVRDFFSESFGDYLKPYLKEAASIDTAKVMTALETAVGLAIDPAATEEVIKNTIKNDIIPELVDTAKMKISELDFDKVDFDTMLKLLDWGKAVYSAATSKTKSVSGIVDAVMNKDAIKLLGESMGVSEVNADFDLVTALLKWSGETVVSAANGSITFKSFVKSFVNFVENDEVVDFAKGAFGLADDTAVKALAEVLNWSVDAVYGDFDIASVVELLTNDDVQSFAVDCVSKLDSKTKDAVTETINEIAGQLKSAKSGVESFVSDNKSGIEALAEVFEIVNVAGGSFSSDKEFGLDAIVEAVEWAVNSVTHIGDSFKSFNADTVTALLSNDKIKQVVKETFGLEEDNETVDVVSEFLTWAANTVQTTVKNKSFDVSSLLTLLENDKIKSFLVDCVTELADETGITEAVSEAVEEAEELAEKNRTGIDAMLALLDWSMDTADAVKNGSFDIMSVVDLLKNEKISGFVVECITEYVDTDAIIADAKAGIEDVTEQVTAAKNAVEKLIDDNKERIESVFDILSWTIDTVKTSVDSNSFDADSVVTLLNKSSVRGLLKESFDLGDDETYILDGAAALLEFVLGLTDGEFEAESVGKLIDNTAVQSMIKNGFGIDDEAVNFNAISELVQWTTDAVLSAIDGGFDMDSITALIRDDDVQAMFRDGLELGDAVDLDFIADLLDLSLDMMSGSFDTDGVAALIKSDCVKGILKDYFPTISDDLDLAAELLDWCISLTKEELTIDKVTELITSENVVAFVKDCFSEELGEIEQEVDVDALAGVLKAVMELAGDIQDGSFGVGSVRTLLDNTSLRSLLTDAFDLDSVSLDVKIDLDAVLDVLSWSLGIIEKQSIGAADIATLVKSNSVKKIVTSSFNISEEDAHLNAVSDLLTWVFGIVDSGSISGSDISTLVGKSSIKSLAIDALDLEGENEVFVTAAVDMLQWSMSIVDRGSVSVSDFQTLIKNTNIQKLIKNVFDIEDGNYGFQFVMDILNWSLNIIDRGGVNAADVVNLIKTDSVEQVVTECLDIDTTLDLSAIGEVLEWILDTVDEGFSVSGLSNLIKKQSVQGFINDCLEGTGIDIDFSGIVDVLCSSLDMLENGVNREAIKSIVTGNFVQNLVGDVATPEDFTIIGDLIDIAFDIADGSFGETDIIKIVKICMSNAITYTDETKMALACVGVVCRLIGGGGGIMDITSTISGVVDEIKDLGNQIVDFFTGKADYKEIAMKALKAVINKVLDKLGPYRDIFEQVIDMISDIDNFDPSELLGMGVEALKMSADQLIYEYVRKALVTAATILDSTYEDNWDCTKYPTYYMKAFADEEELEEYISETFTDKNSTDGLMVKVTGTIRQIGEGEAPANYIVDTSSEPAIINDVLCFEGSDMTFTAGTMSFGIGSVTVGNLVQKAQDLYDSNVPLFNSLIVSGDGTLYLDSSGFTINEGEWSIDFYDGFDKILDPVEETTTTDKEKSKAPEDDSDNGSNAWAIGGLGDKINPLRALAITDIYINRHSLFSAPSFSVAGFSLKFNDYVLRSSQVCFGGSVDFKIVKGEIKNIFFNSSGLQAIEADLTIGIDKKLGLLGNGNSMDGTITIHHYSDSFIEQVKSRGKAEPESIYDIKVTAEMENVGGVNVELGFKKVADGRILPDIISFGMNFSSPGVLITAGTYLTAIRGAIKELADTIAGGSNDVPLTIEAGIDLKFGVAPAEFQGSIDMILKRTGIELNGKLNFNGKKMITEAQIKAQWVTPWFVSAKMEVDLYGLGIILGSFRLMIGQNLELNRTDFEGFISAKVCIPESIPIVGGIPLAQVSFGVNNDKIWGSASVGIPPIAISLGITYYWGGSIEFSTDGEGLPDAYTYLLLEEPEQEPVLMVIGTGVHTEATSYINDETVHEIHYCAIDDGISLLDNGQNNIGIGGIEVSDKGKTHTVPVGTIDEDRDAIIGVEYFGEEKSVEELSDMLTITDEKGNALKMPDGESEYTINVGNMENPVDGNTAFKQELTTEDGVNEHLVYIFLPRTVFDGNDNVVIKSTERIETKLLSTPIAASVESVEISNYDAAAGTTAATEDTQFDVTVTADHPTENDTVTLYLTKEPMGTEKETHYDADGNAYEVTEANEPGIVIAEDVEFTSIVNKKGTVTIPVDLTQIDGMGDGTTGSKGDIRSVLESGEYYIRAELKSDQNYAMNVSEDTILMHDPLAPSSSVSNVTLEPAGNGYFNLSFDRVIGATSYRFDFLDENGDDWSNYSGLAFEASDLEEYLNEGGTRYENLRLGGWTKNGSVETDEDGNILTDESGNIKVNDEDSYYTGLETGRYYKVKVYAANKDADDCYHYAIATTNAENTLLPAPELPKVISIEESKTGEPTLQASEATLASEAAAAKYLTIAHHKPVLNINTDVDATIDVYIGEDYYGRAENGVISMDSLTTDGEYCVEIRATNNKTKDVSVTILYLTIDTIAPTIFITSPKVSESYEFSKGVTISGQTSLDATLVLEYNGEKTELEVDKETGEFSTIVYPAKNQPSAQLVVRATDAAGNINSARVTATNSEYSVPVSIVIRKVSEMKAGETKEIELFVRYSDGYVTDGYETDENGDYVLDENGNMKVKYQLDENGKKILKYREELMTDEELENVTFVVTNGEGATISSDGVISAIKAGRASIVKATYEFNEDYSLSATVSVFVKDDSETDDEGKTDGGKTDDSGKTDGGKTDDTGKTDGGKTDGGKTDDTGKTDGGKTDDSGKTDGGKTDDSGKTDGGNTSNIGGIAISGGDESEETVPAVINSQSAKAQLDGDGIVRINVSDVKNTDGKLKVETQYSGAAGYVLTVDKEAAELITEKTESGKALELVTPIASVNLTSDMLTGEALDISVTYSDKQTIAKANTTARRYGATAANNGEGITVTMGGVSIPKGQSASASIRIPDGVAVKEVTAVLFIDRDGNYTNLPWKVNMEGNIAYADIRLPEDGTVIFATAKASFSDTPSDYWATPYIESAAAKLIVLGKGNNRFDPKSNVTRAEFLTILLRSAGLMASDTADAKFNDVSESEWYADAIAIGVDLGIFQGSDGNARPNDSITRQEAMVLVGRVLELVNSVSYDAVEKDTLDSFTDSEDVADWAEDEISVCVSCNIINGSNGKLLPGNCISRAETATVAVRLEDFIIRN